MAELRKLRCTCCKTLLDMIPNGVYRAQLEVETIINKMRKGRLRWFGHVRRIPQSALVRIVEALVVDELRRRALESLQQWQKLLSSCKTLQWEKRFYTKWESTIAVGMHNIAWGQYLAVGLHDSLQEVLESYLCFFLIFCLWPLCIPASPEFVPHLNKSVFTQSDNPREDGKEVEIGESGGGRRKEGVGNQGAKWERGEQREGRGGKEGREYCLGEERRSCEKGGVGRMGKKDIFLPCLERSSKSSSIGNPSHHRLESSLYINVVKSKVIDALMFW
ncbi:hypothetical protein Tco_1134321 [Tanacetum coccineum]